MKLPTLEIEFFKSGKDMAIARKYAGLTQKELATMVKISPAKLVMMEKLENPSDVLRGAEMRRIMNIIYNQRGSDHE